MLGLWGWSYYVWCVRQGGRLGLREGQDYYCGSWRWTPNGVMALSTGGTQVGEVCLVPVPIWVVLFFTSSNPASYLRGVQGELYRSRETQNNKNATPIFVLSFCKQKIINFVCYKHKYLFYLFSFHETSSFIST